MADNEAKSPEGFVKESVLPLVYLIITLFALRWTLVEPYVVPTGSMEPTLKTGDRLYALKCAYDIRFPFTDWVLFKIRPVKRGDVILFKAPQDPGMTYVKRAVGIPGDHIEMREGVLYVNGKEMSKEPFPDRKVMYDIERKNYKTLYLENLTGIRHYVILDNELPNKRSFEEIVVPPDSVFAVGDNRDNSHDSRAWGFVPMANMKGRAMFIWFSSWDPNLKENMIANYSIPERIFYFVVDFFRFFVDLFGGEAWIRAERVGTAIQ